MDSRDMDNISATMSTKLLLLITVITAVLGGCGAQSCGSPEVFTSDVLDSYTGTLAVDGDSTTCYRSGYQDQPWLVEVLPSQQEVTQVIVTARINGTIKIRVGTEIGCVGRREQFRINRPCGVIRSTSPEVLSHVVTCHEKLTGHVISLEGSMDQNPPINAELMAICEVAL